LWTFISVEDAEANPVHIADLRCSFVADGTIPDRSSVPPKESFEKKWIVKTGPKPWPAGCVLTHVGGHPMGTKRPKFKPAPLGPVPSNAEIELAVCLKAPKPHRDFVSKWRMCTPDGRQFGDFLWALITVEADAPIVESISGAKATKVAGKAAMKAAKIAGKAAMKAAKVAAKAAAKDVKVAAKAAAKEVKVVAKAAAKAAKLAAKTIPAGAKAAAKAAPVAAKAAAKEVKVAAKAAAKAVKVVAKAAAKAARFDGDGTWTVALEDLEDAAASVREGAPRQ